MNSTIKNGLIYLLLLTVAMVSGKNMFLLKGRVLNETTLQPVALANVIIKNTYQGSATDDSGFFKISLNPGKYRLKISHIAYVAKTVSVTVMDKDSNFVLIKLKENTGQLGIVTVNAEREAPLSVFTMSETSMKNIPTVGEPDVLRSIAFLPGIAQQSDYYLGLNFRGGNTDQNQVFWDGVALYNPYHLFGLFSSFNIWALQKATVYTAHFPAEYNGGLSGIIDLESKKKGTKDFTRGNISLLSSNISLARTWKNTFVLAAVRRTYLDLILALFKAKFLYNFYDLNLNVNHKINTDFNIDFIGFMNSDGLSLGKAFNRWGNRLGALRFNYGQQHLLFSFTSHINNAVDENDTGVFDNNLTQLDIKYNARVWSSQHVLEYGAEYKKTTAAYKWNYGLENNRPENIPGKFTGKQFSDLFAAWGSGKFLYFPRFPVTVNARVLRTFKSWAFAPGVLFEWSPKDNISLSLGYDRNLQFWGTGRRPENFKQSPPRFLLKKAMSANQYTAGVKWNFMGVLHLSMEAFYKEFSNIAFLTSALKDYPKFVAGNGNAYGLDAFIEKTQGRVTFQLSYSYLLKQMYYPESVKKTEPQAPHVFKGIIGFRVGHSWNFNISSVYRSGAYYHKALGYFKAVGNYAIENEPNRFDPGDLSDYFILDSKYARFKPYLRFDIALKKRYKGVYFDWTLYLQVQNITFHTNVLNINSRKYNQRLYKYGRAGDESYLSGLPILPTVGVEFSF